ncbi:hypothetical protein [Streptomyces sp. NPDC085665]|uniref:hypothetical protein n=1 Tax=Streptomyces sp. NPDC085665 TaxID=3365735 RepID=UPI0037D6567D
MTFASRPFAPQLPPVRDPFKPTIHENMRAVEIERTAWRPLVAHLGTMADMHVLSGGGDLMTERQPGVSYAVRDTMHRGRVVGFWEPGAVRPMFQLRAASMERPEAARIIGNVRLLGGCANPRPLYVVQRGTGSWTRDAALHRPERCATFRRDINGRYRVYTRLMTAAELEIVLEGAAFAIRKAQAIRHLSMQRRAELRLR